VQRTPTNTELLRLLPLAVVAAALLAASCFSERKPATDGAARPGSSTGATTGGEGDDRLDDSSLFSDPLNIQNLTVWPIIAEKIRELGQFLSLGEAQTQGVAVVKEVGTASEGPAQPPSLAAAPAAPAPRQESAASPPAQTDVRQTQSFQLAPPGPAASTHALLIENRGDLPILVCGGTIVKGEKEDRQVAQDFVIAPRTSTPVDSFCIEARCASEPHGKDLHVRTIVERSSSRHELSASVTSSSALPAKAAPAPALLASVEETEEQAREKRSAIEKAVREHFKLLRASGKVPVGFAYAVNGKPVTVRTFAHPQIFDGQFEPFVKAMSIDADRASRATAKASANSTQPTCAPASLKDVLALVHSINREQESVSPTSAANKSGRRTNEKGGNSSCYVESPITKGELVPLTRDWTSKP
jgi:hypothetical protein